MSLSHRKCWAVVPAAGVGKRMGAATPKQYLPLAGRPMLVWTLESLLAEPAIEALCVVVSADDRCWSSLGLAHGPRLQVVMGGMERCHSVLNGLHHLASLADLEDWVLVHDAARPCLASADLRRLMTHCMADEVGGLLAVPVRDTLKRESAAGRIEHTVDRNRLWHALTPQMFRLGTLTRALEQALDSGQMVTDESQAIEALGLKPLLVEGQASNLKVTRPEDLWLAERFLLEAR